MTTWETFEQARAWCDSVSDAIGDWQGVPVPLGEDHPVIVHDRHPLRNFFAELAGGEVEIPLVVGGPDDVDERDETFVNHWFCWKLNVDVFVFRRESTGCSFAVKVPRAPDGSMDRFEFWMRTLGASDAWDVDAEHRAREKLRGMVSDRQWRHYDLTGSFLETSDRSRLTYLFRRLRPTVVMTPRWPWWKKPQDSMKVLAVLCMHPIGYYGRSWAGCMVPSDDVVAHLSMMRGDEAYFWRCANQHESRLPEAGL